MSLIFSDLMVTKTVECYLSAYAQFHGKFRQNPRNLQGFRRKSCE